MNKNTSPKVSRKVIYEWEQLIVDFLWLGFSCESICHAFGINLQDIKNIRRRVYGRQWLGNRFIPPYSAASLNLPTLRLRIDRHRLALSFFIFIYLKLRKTFPSEEFNLALFRISFNRTLAIFGNPRFNNLNQENLSADLAYFLCREATLNHFSIHTCPLCKARFIEFECEKRIHRPHCPFCGHFG